MPIIIARPRTPPPTPIPPRLPNRRRDAAIKALAPDIAEIRQAGHHGNAEIAKSLNERGLRAPSGGRFSTETTGRILQRLKQLGLGGGPQSVSAALKARHAKERARQAKELAEPEARRKREHPDWDE
jgi:hypothetical protein